MRFNVIKIVRIFKFLTLIVNNNYRKIAKKKPCMTLKINISFQRRV